MIGDSHGKHVEIKLAKGLSLDGYLMPDGSFRFGIEKHQPLLNGIPVEGIKIHRSQFGEVSSVSLDDFVAALGLAAHGGNATAINLLAALSRVSLEDYFRQAFGEEVTTLEEKQEIASEFLLKMEEYSKLHAFSENSGLSAPAIDRPPGYNYYGSVEEANFKRSQIEKYLGKLEEEDRYSL